VALRACLTCEDDGIQCHERPLSRSAQELAAQRLPTPSAWASGASAKPMELCEYRAGVESVTDVYAQAVGERRPRGAAPRQVSRADKHRPCPA